MSLGTPKVVIPEPPENKLFFETKIQFEIQNFTNYQSGVEVSGEIEIPQIGAKCLLKFNTRSQYKNLYANSSAYHYKDLNITVAGLCKEFQTPDKYEIKTSILVGDKVVLKGSKTRIYSDCVHVKGEFKNEDCKLDSSGTLTLDVKISMFIKETSAVPIHVRNLNVNYSKLLEEHKQMLAISKFSDFKFIVKDKEFKVHRIILAAASPVFSRMFDAGMAESKSNSCTLNYIEPEIFEDILHFIYERKLPENLADVAIKLFEAVHYFEIPELKEICIQDIPRLLKTENAIEMFNWACVYDENLKIEAWKIVKREILKIYLPMKNEPPATPEGLQKMILRKKQIEMLSESLAEL